MMIQIAAMIPMCFVFSTNCQNYGYYFRDVFQLAAKVALYVIHTIVHSLVLIYFVPMLMPDYTFQALL